MTTNQDKPPSQPQREPVPNPIPVPVPTAFQSQVLFDLQEMIVLLKQLLRVPVPAPPPRKISLALPIIKRKGKIMANFELADDTVAFIAIHVTDAAGDVVPAPSGDVFSAVSSDPTKMTAAIGVMPSGPMTGAVALVLTPLVKLAPALTATVTDTAALTSIVQIVDIVADLTPTAIALDIVDAVLVPQPTPAT